MPELPDLEVFSNNLDRELSGKKLSMIKVHLPSNIKEENINLSKALQSAKLHRVYREGKELRFQFDNDHILGMHLMLRGKLFYFEDKNDKKSSILEMKFSDGKGIVLTDPLKKATVFLDPKESKVPDALSRKFSITYLQQKMSDSKAAIKSLMSNQNIVRGIGSAYSDDMLWEAGISPFSQANKIPEKKVKELHTAIKKVFRKGIKSLNKEFPGSINTETRDFLLIHNPRREKSPTGAIIKKQDKGMTKTYYTDEQVKY